MIFDETLQPQKICSGYVQNSPQPHSFLPSIKNSLDFQIWRNKYFHYSTKQKNPLNILGLLCRIEKINIFIILPSMIKTPLIYCVFFAELKKIYYSTKQKKLLKYPGSSLQNWKNKYYSTKQKTSLNILAELKIFLKIAKKILKNIGSSLQNWKIY